MTEILIKAKTMYAAMTANIAKGDPKSDNTKGLTEVSSNISSLITTIESQQKDIGRLDHWMRYYKGQSEHHEREAMTYQGELTKSMEQVESQKEEIEQLRDICESLYQLTQRSYLTSFDLKEADRIYLSYTGSRTI